MRPEFAGQTFTAGFALDAVLLFVERLRSETIGKDIRDAAQTKKPNAGYWIRIRFPVIAAKFILCRMVAGDFTIGCMVLVD